MPSATPEHPHGICARCAKAPSCRLRRRRTKPRRSCESFVLYTGYRDLCCTCDHARRCRAVGTAEHPVFFCEEFAARRNGHTADATAATQETSTAEHGLCAYCDDRGTCQAVRPEGGVWHCEEYR